MANEKDTMDVTEFIAEMQKRPALWHQKHVLYHNRQVTNKMWIELAALLNVQKPYLRTKWKGLRDTFRCELKKDMIYRATNSPKNKPTWKHYKDLAFLKEQMHPKPPVWDLRENPVDPLVLFPSTSRSVLRTPEKDSEDPIEDMDFIEVKQEIEGDFPLEQPERLETEFNGNFPSCDDSNPLSETPTLDETRSPNATSNENASRESFDPIELSGQFDDNYHFLMSLLPHIQKISGERQMLLRMQIQEMVYKEVYKKID